MKKLILALFVLFQFSSFSFAQETDAVEEQEEKVYTRPETMPQFPDGREAMKVYFQNNINFPQAAKENGISGKVYVNFRVGKEGEISHVKIVRGVHDLLDKEAIRVVEQMPKWTPGNTWLQSKMKKEAVAVSMNLPVSFVLTPEELKAAEKAKSTDKKKKKKKKKKITRSSVALGFYSDRKNLPLK
jgi:protein TonB